MKNNKKWWSKNSYVLGQRRRQKMIKGFPVLSALLLSILVAGLAMNPAVRAVGGQERLAYYGNWDIYGNNYFVKDIDRTGTASQLTTLVYSFENINPTTLKCFQDIVPVDDGPNSESDPNAGDGGADAWADYQMPMTAAQSVDGQADSQTQALRGNFNQLKKLKQKHPNLKIMLSIGGWSFSKYFSDAAQPANRAAFVSSCIDMYIRGNLPTGVHGDTTGAGGAGVAKGIFDGIDIDWEFPGSANGHLGNHSSPSDTANYTALLAEFRSQLNAQGNADGKYYRLSAAVPSGGDDINKIQVSSIAQYLDYAGVMSYDMHGAWENHTNFQGALYPSPNDPDAAMGFTVDEAVKRWTNAGFPASKLNVGLPFYWRGWSGVPAGSNSGLYQPATGGSPVYPLSGQAGVAHYKELLSANKLTTANIHWDNTTKSPWVYDNGNFYTGDTPSSLAQKGAYIRANGLRGAMIYALESDDPSGTLMKSVTAGLNGGTPPPIPSGAALQKMERAAASSPNTATNGEPINMIGGNYLATRNELVLPNKDNPVSFSLSYNSAAAGQYGPDGWGWTNNYRVTAVAADDGSVGIQNPDGRIDVYTPNSGGGYTAPQGLYDTLTFANNKYTVVHSDHSVFNFNTDGLLASIVSPNGNTQTMAYDSDNNLSSVTDSVGRQLTFTYNRLGLLATVTDPSNRVVTYTYDDLGQLISVKNPSNVTTNYAYDTSHQIVTVTDPRGNNVVNNIYDADGRVTQQTNGRGKTISLDYSTPGQTTYTDANGGHTIYYYDSNLRVTKMTDPMGGDTVTTYDAAGNVATTTDANNHTTSYTYDTHGNPTQVTDALNGVQSFTYDSNNNLLTRTDQLNHVTTYTYDSHGNVITYKDPLNNTSTLAYDGTGQLASVTDPLNNLTGFVYDAQGNHVTTTDASNRNTYYGYDVVGRLTAVEDADNNETDYTLDAMDHVTKITDPSGHDTNITYDQDGDKTQLTDANGHITKYEYDENRNLTKTTDANNHATTYAYDGNDNLTSKTDARGKQTTYVYDLNNRQTQTTDPLGNVSKVVYDAVGNVVQRIDASNRTTTYAYDALNRLVTTTYPDSSVATNTYDVAGNLLTATNSTGTTTNTYDANNRILTSKDPHNATVSYTYNTAGSLTQVKYPDNKTVSYTYTPAKQLSTAKDWNNQTTTYLYDNEGRVATKTYPNTFKATYAYDENGNLSSLTYKKNGSAFTQFNYARDNVGNITEEEELKAGSGAKYHDYTYDATNQVTQDDAPTDTYNFTYDAVGNMATSQNGNGTSNYTYNDGNQLTAKTNTNRSFTYDPQGNQITDTGKTLAYNYDNQLKTFTSGSLTTNYAYDALGNRTDKAQTGTGAVNYQYVNMGNNNVLQAKNLTAGTNQYFVYGVDQISQGDTASSSRQYFLDDGTGTVRYLTNNTGGTVTSYAYDTYGKQLTGSTTASNYTYQNEQKDPESGYTFLRARYYDPTVSKFTSSDPLSGDTMLLASQNGYNYANGNPVNMADPTGQFGLDTAAVGGILGGITGAVTSGISYYAQNHQNFSWTDFGANVAGGAASGAISGACMGLGVQIVGGGVCGAAGNAVGSFITQAFDSTKGVSFSQVGNAAMAGGISGVIGGVAQNNISALKINRGWIALANHNPSYSAKNIVPGLETGSLGRKFQLNNALGALLGVGVDQTMTAIRCNW